MVKASKTKVAHTSSESTIDIGRERKERIEDFRARRRLAGQKITTQEEAINILIDRGLEMEPVTV